MKELGRIWVVGPAMALVFLLSLLIANRGALEELAFLRQHQGSVTGLVDQSPYQTAQALTGQAVSSEEQTFAQQAEKLADHEVDQAFATALRLSQQKAATRTLTGEAAELEEKVEQLKSLVKDDQTRVDSLTAAARSSNTPAAAGDDLDVAQAQLGRGTIWMSPRPSLASITMSLRTQPATWPGRPAINGERFRRS